jgi:hypothetical protein
MAEIIQGDLIVRGNIIGPLLGNAITSTSSSFASTASYINPLRQTVTITGSLNVSGSTTQIGNNTLLGNTTLSGSITISGSSGPGATTASVQIYGDIRQSGYHRFDPVTTNIDTSTSASYIYVSGSTQDLYFSQNSAGYSNVTRLRWIEGNLYTGLLHGGLISASVGGTTYQIGSGSGIIVNLNASLSDDPYPTIKYLNWGNLSASIAPLTASYQQAFVSIDSTGNIFQQGTPYSNGQFDTVINIGVVLFQNGSTINGVKTQPSVAYGFEQQQNIFNRAFGPLKLSGYTLAPSGSSTRSLIVAGGTAYSPGSNYPIDPNEPSYTVDSGTNISKIFRYRQSGSTWVYDTNGGAGYTDIDPTQYSNNGVLTAVPGGGSNRQFSIQRVFYFPNSVAKAIVVYYGNATYESLTDATSNISFEPFIEAPNTAANAIYLGAIIVRNNADFTVTDSYAIQAGGLFRSVGGAGGGGSVITQTLSGLSDVNISGPTVGQALVYNNTSAKWENASFISASISGNASTATSASFASTASFAPDYVLTSVTSSFATTSSNRFNGNQTITGSLVISSSADPQFVIGNNLLRVSSSGQLGISGSIVPNVHNTYTLGTTSVRFATLFVQGTVNGNTGLFNNINMGSSTPMSIINNTSQTVAQWYGPAANLRLQSGSTPAYVDNGYRLQINSLGAVSGGFYITGSTNQQLMRIDAAGTNGILLVSSSGNIGLGTINPNYKLDIFNGSIEIVPSGSTGPSSVALVVSGSGTKGGAGFIDFLQVTNATGSATNPNKYFRLNTLGSLQILNSAYTSTILDLTDSGILQVAGGNSAATSDNEPVTNYLAFQNNNSQIYDDGNFHIHTKGSGQAMWINTNGGQLNLLTQKTVSGSAVSGSGVSIGGGGTLTGYVTINHSKDYTTAASYGYLTTAGAGTYPGGSQTVNLSLYAVGRIWGQEIDAFSDERMKDIKGDISLSDGIKLVKNLKPIEYTWKDDTNKGLKAGYSAQQVSKAGFDHLISLVPKEGLEETIDKDGFLSPKDTQFSMNYDQVVPYHGVVIKHLLEKIEQLEKEIQLLKEE